MLQNFRHTRYSICFFFLSKTCSRHSIGFWVMHWWNRLVKPVIKIKLKSTIIEHCRLSTFNERRLFVLLNFLTILVRVNEFSRSYSSFLSWNCSNNTVRCSTKVVTFETDKSINGSKIVWSIYAMIFVVKSFYLWMFLHRQMKF